MNTMMSILNRMVCAEEGYFRRDASRESLVGVVRRLRREYCGVRGQSVGEESERVRMAVLFVLRRMTDRLWLEDRLMWVVDMEVEFIRERMRRLVFGTHRRQEAVHVGSRNAKPRTRANFPVDISQLLRSWLKENMDNPYPSDAEKAYLCRRTGLGAAQINNWFINARRRILPFMKGKYVNFQ